MANINYKPLSDPCCSNKLWSHRITDYIIVYITLLYFVHGILQIKINLLSDEITRQNLVRRVVPDHKIFIKFEFFNVRLEVSELQFLCVNRRDFNEIQIYWTFHILFWLILFLLLLWGHCGTSLVNCWCSILLIFFLNQIYDFALFVSRVYIDSIIREF